MSREDSGPLDIRQPEIGERLYKALDVLPNWRGTIDPKVALTVPLEDLMAPEFWYLRGGRSFVYSRGVGALAGNVSGLQLLPSPGTLAIIDKVIVSNISGLTLGFAAGLGISAAGTNDNPTTRDDRQPSTLVPGAIAACQAQLFQVALSPNIGNAASVVLPADAVYTIEGPWVMAGSQAFVVKTDNVNRAMAAAIFWRERRLMPVES